ncbi:MAG TPA: TolC family protein [Vicinamibacteria bacterium]|nr:TolC family protein [Vicinamibacteria bacterium]
MSRAAFALLLVSAAPAFAQAPAPSPSPRPTTLASPAPDGRPVLDLSLDDAVKRTLENNADIAVERYNPEESDYNVRQLKGYYEPYVISTLGQRSNTQPASNAFAGAAAPLTRTLTYNFGAFQSLPTGGTFEADFNNNRQTTNSVFSAFNPSFASNFNLSLSQPLLRNFSIDSTRYQIKVAKKNQEISDVQFRQSVVNTVANVKSAYYDLIYALDNLEAQRSSLGLAQQLLEENRIKVRVGTMAPLDVVAAQSEVASREAGVIAAEAAVSDAEDTLKRAMFTSNEPASWDTRIVPTDRPTAEPVTVDVAAAIQTATQKRTDIQAARKNLESTEYGIAYARNQLLPQLNLAAAYGTSGIGGTLIQRQGLGGPIISTVPGGYGDAVSDVFGRNFPTWSVTANLSYPVLNRQAGANSARARISHDQQQASVHRLEMQITQEVRAAGRAVETNYKLVESNRAARVLQEQRLDAETKKFAAGMSTNFLVTQAQRDLALAQVAELQAVANYRKSLVNFDRVQEAGVGGGGGNAVVSVGASAATRTGTGGSAGATSGANTGGTSGNPTNQ